MDYLLSLTKILLTLLAIDLFVLLVYHSIKLYQKISEMLSGLEIAWSNLKESWENIKVKTKEIFTVFQDKYFHEYFDMFFGIFLVSFFYLKSDSFYLFLFLPVYICFRIMIWIVKDILKSTEDNKNISEYWFFCYIGLFSLIIVGFIFSFSFLYFHAFSLQHGQFYDDKSQVTTLDRQESILYSAYTFFTMNYKNFISKGFLAYFTISEVFISQIIFITFIGIMAAKLIERIKLKGA